MYFTITAVKKIIRYTEDFVTSRFHSSPDALPLSYRRLVGTKATKLGSRDRHPADC